MFLKTCPYPKIIFRCFRTAITVGASDNEKIHLKQIVRSCVEYSWSRLPLTSYQQDRSNCILGSVLIITGVKGGLLLNIRFVLKWSLLLLSHFSILLMLIPVQCRLFLEKHFRVPSPWKHCRRMKLYHLIHLFEAFCCFLFFCNNPISFTAIYGIINTWKNEYTFFRK